MQDGGDAHVRFAVGHGEGVADVLPQEAQVQHRERARPDGREDGVSEEERRPKLE